MYTCLQVKEVAPHTAVSSANDVFWKKDIKVSLYQILSLFFIFYFFIKYYFHIHSKFVYKFINMHKS